MFKIIQLNRLLNVLFLKCFLQDRRHRKEITQQLVVPNVFFNCSRFLNYFGKLPANFSFVFQGVIKIKAKMIII